MMTEQDTSGAGPQGRRNRDVLEDCFAAARQAPPVPSDAFMARLLADAAAQQSGTQKSSAQTEAGAAAQHIFRALPAPGVTWQQRLRRIMGDVLRGLAPLGGAPGLAGLTSATLAGVWIGFAAPAPLSALEGIVTGIAVTDAVYDATFDDPEALLLAEITPFLTAEDQDDQ